MRKILSVYLHIHTSWHASFLLLFLSDIISLQHKEFSLIFLSAGENSLGNCFCHFSLLFLENIFTWYRILGQQTLFFPLALERCLVIFFWLVLLWMSCLLSFFSLFLFREHVFIFWLLLRFFSLSLVFNKLNMICLGFVKLLGSVCWYFSSNLGKKISHYFSKIILTPMPPLILDHLSYICETTWYSFTITGTSTFFFFSPNHWGLEYSALAAKAFTVRVRT